MVHGHEFWLVSEEEAKTIVEVAVDGLRWRKYL